MYKNLLYILFFLLLTIGVSSQEFPSKIVRIKDSLKGSIPESKLTTRAFDSIKSNSEILKKNDFPSNQKLSPEIIYIINDKPVNREEFIKQNYKKL